MSRVGRLTGSISALAVGAAAFTAMAQGVPPNPSLTFGITTGAEWNDNFELEENPEDDSFLQTNSLSLDYESSTSTSSFEVGVGGDFDYRDTPNRDTTSYDLENPSANLQFSRANSASLFDLFARYQRSEVVDTIGFDFDEAGLPGQTLVVDNGDRVVLQGGVGFEYGAEDPIGAVIDLDYSETSFENTTDPDLFDNSTFRGDAELRFDVSPVVSTRVTAGFTDFSTEGDESETDRENYGVGADFEIRPDLRASADISFAELTTTGGGEPDETVSDREGRFRLDRDVINGSYFGEFSRILAREGTRSELRFGRELSLATGELSISLGVTDSAEGEQFFSGGFSFERELLSGSFFARAEQSIRNTADQEEVLTTSASVGYERDLTALSRFGVDLSLREVADTGPDDEEDQTFVSVDLVYDYDLTRDWTLSTGYRGRISREADRDNATSNALFFNLTRDFTISP